jgi:two-component system LytT family response regulator
MIQCLLIDDEPLALSLLEDNLKHVSYIQIAGRCRNAAEAIRYMQSEQIDLIFCDIHMPGLNGLQLVKSLIKKPMVIFITAYEKFAVESFELDAIDYLVKPVPLDRFLRACQKAYNLFELNNGILTQTAVPKNYFFINADYNLVRINFSDIEYIEGLKDYVKINLVNQPRSILSRISLKAIELQLPHALFYRVHKSYLVNVNYVSSIRRGKIKIANAELPLSDNYRNVINRMIGREVE